MTWNPIILDRLAQLMGERAGLALANREGAMEGAKRAMARAGMADAGAYLQHVAGNTPAFDDLIDELTVGETYFFREPAQFALIRNRILPEFGVSHFLSAWSAGCASGEEAYSLAIVLDQQRMPGQFAVLGTDLSRRALARARKGVYGAWSLRGEGAEQARPYLRPVGAQFEIGERFRRHTRFAQFNLAGAADLPASAPSGFDLILCRNVLIYFVRDAINRVARRLFAALAEGGWLLTASSDPPLADLAPFEVVATSDGLLYRRPPAAVSMVPEAPMVMGRWPDAAPAAVDQPSAVELPLEVAPCPLQAAWAQSDFREVVRLTEGPGQDARTMAYRVRALANLDPVEAERTCADALRQHALSAELHYLHALVLLDLGRAAEAVQALRRVLYLDRSLASAHLLLGSALRLVDDLAGAQRAFRNACTLCADRPADEVAPLTDGETHGALAAAAAAQLAVLEGRGGDR